MQIPSLARADWLDSEPVDPDGLRGNVVVVNFWTFTCINWLRQVPYLRAWSQAYRKDGLVVVGVHTPEFSFENEPARVRRAVKERELAYPVVLDNDYAVWESFGNRYWPALYFFDRQGVLRDQHFGEGRYKGSESLLQRLLDVDRDAVQVDGVGVEQAADWDHLQTPETYLGHRRSLHSTSHRIGPGGEGSDELPVNHWGLAGEWTTGPECIVSDQPGGRIVLRFHARDAHLVMSPGDREPIPFQVLLDGEPPGGSHGLDVDEQGRGLLAESRLYQLSRRRGPVQPQTLEITFLAPGAEAFAFTFG